MGESRSRGHIWVVAAVLFAVIVWTDSLAGKVDQAKAEIRRLQARFDEANEEIIELKDRVKELEGANEQTFQRLDELEEAYGDRQ